MTKDELYEELSRAFNIIENGIEEIEKFDSETYSDIMGAVGYFRKFIDNKEITGSFLTMLIWAMKLGGTYALLEAPGDPIIVVEMDYDYNPLEEDDEPIH
ncbi:MAG: hypothetical protein KAS32_14790 [Candidatus Peribacteraceae bacterium]|nr:hypothetical protein [Candidatus Peribacteraceae bacterium]